MRHLATTLSIMGTILICTGAICLFISTVATTGVYTLFTLGGIGLGLGMIFFVVHWLAERSKHHGRR